MGSASSWEHFRNFPHLLQPSLPHLSENTSRSPLKILSVCSTGRSLTPHQARRFFFCRLEGGVYQICLRRHRPKGVSAGAAGSQLLQKPALEAQGNPKPQLLSLATQQAPIHSSPSHLSLLPETPLPPILHPKIITLSPPHLSIYEFRK
jgi:hypothetical protein